MSVNINVQKFLKLVNSNTNSIEQLSLEDVRRIPRDIQRMSPASLSDMDIKLRTFIYNNKPISLIVVSPKKINKTLPVFMFFHGGGWVSGDFESYARLVRDLVIGSGASAVFVNYALSPEAKFPEAINQAYAATCWVAENGKELNVDGNRLAVVGDSAGGNIAAVVCLMAKAKGTPIIKCQVLLCPIIDSNFDTPSYNKFANGYFLTKDMLMWFWDHYIADPKQREEIYASPLKATIEQLKGLPPALIETAEYDMLRDEGEAYANKLNAAGVHVTSVRYNGMIHNFFFLNILSSIPESQAALQQISEQLKKHLDIGL